MSSHVVAVFHRLGLFREMLTKALAADQRLECFEMNHEEEQLYPCLDDVRPNVAIVDCNLPEGLTRELVDYAQRCDWDMRVILLISFPAGVCGWVHENSSLDDVLQLILDEALCVGDAQPACP